MSVCFLLWLIWRENLNISFFQKRNMVLTLPASLDLQLLYISVICLEKCSNSGITNFPLNALDNNVTHLETALKKIKKYIYILYRYIHIFKIILLNYYFKISLLQNTYSLNWFLPNSRLFMWDNPLSFLCCLKVFNIASSLASFLLIPVLSKDYKKIQKKISSLILQK